MKQILATLLIAASLVQADGYLEGNFQITDPQKDFGEAIKRTVFGGNVGGGYLFDPVPVGIGAEFGGMYLGKHETQHDLLTNLVKVKQTINSSAFMGHIYIRTKLPKGPVRPYGDALLGFKSFKTESSITNRDKDTIATTENLKDNAISYGFRGGVTIHPKRKSPLGINLAAQYLWGGEAEYIDASNPACIVVTSGNQFALNPLRSKTDMLTFSLGVTLDLK